MRAIAAGAVAAALFGCSAAVAAEQSGGGGGGMPQLDFANPLTTAQVVWGAIIFLVLYLLLRNWALPQVGEVLERRAATIGAELELARTAKIEAEGALVEQSEAMRKARADAQAEIAAAVARAQKESADRAASLNIELERQLSAAERRIEAARTSALGALREVASDAADSLVSRMIGRAPAPDAVARAVRTALAARGQG